MVMRTLLSADNEIDLENTACTGSRSRLAPRRTVWMKRCILKKRISRQRNIFSDSLTLCVWLSVYNTNTARSEVQFLLLTLSCVSFSVIIPQRVLYLTATKSKQNKLIYYNQSIRDWCWCSISADEASANMPLLLFLQSNCTRLQSPARRKHLLLTLWALGKTSALHGGINISRSVHKMRVKSVSDRRSVYLKGQLTQQMEGDECGSKSFHSQRSEWKSASFLAQLDAENKMLPAV